MPGEGQVAEPDERRDLVCRRADEEAREQDGGRDHRRRHGVRHVLRAAHCGALQCRTRRNTDERGLNAFLQLTAAPADAPASPSHVCAPLAAACWCEGMPHSAERCSDFLAMSSGEGGGWARCRPRRARRAWLGVRKTLSTMTWTATSDCRASTSAKRPTAHASGRRPASPYAARPPTSVLATTNGAPARGRKVRVGLPFPIVAQHVLCMHSASLIQEADCTPRTARLHAVVRLLHRTFACMHGA